MGHKGYETEVAPGVAVVMSRAFSAGRRGRLVMSAGRVDAGNGAWNSHGGPTKALRSAVTGERDRHRLDGNDSGSRHATVQRADLPRRRW